jgi:hypothetical protein
MRVLALAVIGLVVAGCATTPKEPVTPEHTGPDVDVEVLAMHSRPLRVMRAPVPVVKPKEVEKPRPRRKRRRAKPPVTKKVELPPTQRFVPKAPVVDEAPIDIPAEGDWPAALSKEFQRREEGRKRRGDEEAE